MEYVKQLLEELVEEGLVMGVVDDSGYTYYFAVRQPSIFELLMTEARARVNLDRDGTYSLE